MLWDIVGHLVIGLSWKQQRKLMFLEEPQEGKNDYITYFSIRILIFLFFKQRFEEKYSCSSRAWSKTFDELSNIARFVKERAMYLRRYSYWNM